MADPELPVGVRPYVKTFEFCEPVFLSFTVYGVKADAERSRLTDPRRQVKRGGRQ